MRIIYGFLLLLIGVALALGSTYRIQQVGRTWLIHPLHDGATTLEDIHLEPAMNPLRFSLQAQWLHHPRPLPQMEYSARLTLSDDRGAIVWTQELAVQAPADSTGGRSQLVEQTHAFPLLSLDHKGDYRIDIVLRPGRGQLTRSFLVIDVNQLPKPWHIPLLGVALALLGLGMLISGVHSRNRQLRQNS